MDLSVEKSLKYGSFVVAFFVPWICFGRWVFPHTTSKAFLLYGLISILTALWIYLVSTDTRYRFSKREWLMITPLLLYVLWMTIAGLTAKNVGLAFWGTLMRETGLLTLYATSLFALLITSLSKRYEGYIYKLLTWVVAGGAVVTASVWLGDEGFNAAVNVLRRGSGGGVTGNSSLAGAFLLFILGFTAFLVAHKQTIKKTWLWILGTTIMFSPLFFNAYGFFQGKGILGSARGALIGSIIGAIVAFAVYATLSSKKIFRALGVGGLIVGMVVFGVVWNKLVTPGTKVHQAFIEQASGTRFAFWEIAQKAMHERPLVGYGPENFPIAQARYFDPQFLSRDLAFEAWTDHPHNVYYDNGVAAGYPGIAFYILFVGSLVYVLYRNKTLTNLQKSILVGTLIGYLIQNLVAFDGFVTIFALATFASVVYGSSVSVEQKNIIEEKSWHPTLLWGLLALSVVGVYYLSYQPACKAKLYATVLGSKLDKRIDRYDEFLSGSSVGTYWDASGFGYDEYKLYARDPLAVKQDPKLLPYAKRDIDAYIGYLEEVAKTNKTDYRLYFTIVNLYNTKIYFSDLPYDPAVAVHMTELIKYAHGLAPTDPRIHWLYAQLAAWKGDINGVIAAYQQGIKIDPTLPVSHKLLLQFLQGIGNQKLYKEALLNAQKEIPGFSMQ